jgi:hypothetical protein
LEVNPSLPVKTVAEFIAYAKAHPGEINRMLAGEDVKGHMANLGGTVIIGTPDDFGGLPHQRDRKMGEGRQKRGTKARLSTEILIAESELVAES